MDKRELNPRDSEVDFTPRRKRQPDNLLKVMNYNIWDKVEYWEERVQQIVRIIKDNSPDVCCLHEVSQPCYTYIRDALKSFYLVFQAFIDEGDKVGSVLLCKLDTVSLPEGSQPYYYDFPRSNGRVIGVELVIQSNGDRVNMLCTKLDDHPDNDHIRNEQFKVVQQVLKGLRNCILAGDFNIFHDDEDIIRELTSSKLTDAWVKLGCPNRVKYTFDGKRNTITKDRSQLRASRVYYTGHFQPKAFSLVGTSHISASLRITPSCHYGVISTFRCR